MSHRRLHRLIIHQRKAIHRAIIRTLQASAAGQPNVNQSYANQPYSNQAYNSGTNNNAYGSASAGSTDNSYSRMNMNGQAYQQTAKPKKQRAPRKPGAFGPFAAKTVAAALIFGLVGGGVFTGVSYIGTRAISNSSTASAKLTTTTSGGTKQTSSGNAKDLTDVSSVVDEVMPSIGCYHKYRNSHLQQLFRKAVTAVSELRLRYHCE